MKHVRERALLGALILGGPLLVYLLVIRPGQARIRTLRARIQAADAQWAEAPLFDPLRPEEHRRLEDPRAPWRGRLVAVKGDLARIAHYHEVVSEWQKVSREGGAPLADLRSSWDPVKGSFSLPGAWSGDGDARPGPQDGPDWRVEGFVLEARVEGGTAALFRALSLVPSSHPLLEPVGLRWQQFPGEPRRQLITVRNLVLVP